MKISVSNHKSMKGFTLIEMIGVLAVIAILMSLLVPKVFEAINNARINGTAVSVQTVKTGVIDHYAKFGTFLVDGSTSALNPSTFALGGAQALQFDKVLLSEQLIDKPFACRIGDGVYSSAATRIDLVAAATTTTVAASDGSFDLDGDGDNDALGSVVARAVITGVLQQDALQLNRAIDGTSAALGTDTGADTRGRVKYDANPSTTVYVYLTHR